jgi:hypothetical protein
VLAASDGDTYLLDARSGRALRRITGGGQPLAVDERDGRALIGGQGHLRLINTHDGAPVGPVIERGAVDTLSIQVAAVDERVGRVYMATDRSVVVIDEHSGWVWRVLSLPRAPLDLAVDAAAQRLFVLPDSTTAVPARADSALPLVRWMRRTLPWLPLPAPPPPSARGVLIVLDAARL